MHKKTIKIFTSNFVTFLQKYALIYLRGYLYYKGVIILQIFEQIYSEYFAGIYHFLYRLCRDENLAEELTQETFYQAFKSFLKFKGNSEIFTWLASIAKHTYFRYLKKNKLCLDNISIDSITDFYCENNSDNPEEFVQRDYVSAAVKNIINTIPDKYKDVVILRIYAELSFAEISRALGISENSAKVIYCRAKKMLTEELKNEFKL